MTMSETQDVVLVNKEHYDELTARLEECEQALADIGPFVRQARSAIASLVLGNPGLLMMVPPQVRSLLESFQ